MIQKSFIRTPLFSPTPGPRISWRWWSVVLCCGLLFMACAGSKNTKVSDSTSGDEIDIDKLLETPADQDKQKAEDDEVYRLLGITPEKTDAPKTETPATGTEVPPAGITDLQQEVNRLQGELDAKNQQVVDLRNSLMERDAKIQEMQQQVMTREGSRSGGGNGYVQRYAEARNLYEQRRYSEAAAVFQEILSENGENSYADNCQYWIGECYYGMSKYAEAVAEFEKVFAFKRSNKNDAALVKIGLCYLQMGERQQARSQFEQLIATYPSSTYVAKARKYLDRL
jgi:tol-pal system protein YbgF